jgi:hypothetical protein
MKIKTILLHSLRNDGHFQFITALISLIVKFGAETLGIMALFAILLTRHRDEDEALKKIVKSATTAEIEEADRQRDRTFRGLTDACHAALNHYESKVVIAAKRLDVVMHTYGNLARKPLNEETSAVYNFCTELSSDKYAADVEIAGLTGWVVKLGSDNRNLDTLMMARNAENAAVTHLKLKDCREKTDAVYHQIAERINALIVVNGEEQYAGFVNELNQLIEKYSNAIAQRAGKRRKVKSD